MEPESQALIDPTIEELSSNERQVAGSNRTKEINEALLPAYQKAGNLMLTDEEQKALMEPFPHEMVEERPHDRLLYIPHIVISDRLCKVFGPGNWTTIRRRDWIDNNRIYAEWVLIVRGCFIGESVGAMDYHPNNPRMNFSDALEGTRGECLRRIAAKELGCGSQVWYPNYKKQWLEAKKGGYVPVTPNGKVSQESPPKNANADELEAFARDLDETIQHAIALQKGDLRAAHDYVLENAVFTAKDGKVVKPKSLEQVRGNAKWWNMVKRRVKEDYSAWEKSQTTQLEFNYAMKPETLMQLNSYLVKDGNDDIRRLAYDFKESRFKDLAWDEMNAEQTSEIIEHLKAISPQFFDDWQDK